MALEFNFDPALINSVPLFEVRAIVGDIDETDVLLDDRLITSFIDRDGVTEAAARLAEHLAAKFARQATQRTGDISVNFSDLSKQFQKLAEDIRRRQGLSGVIPEVGGLSIAEKIDARRDTDLTQPSFERGMHDNPRTHSREELRSDDHHHHHGS